MKKLRLTESELIVIIKSIISEQEGTEGGGVESGTSDAGGTGASTWSTGLTRGAANPAGGGVTHWADSYSTSRGKANPLWEEEDEELLKESKWYNTFLDVVGIVDPTGIADGINAISYFRQGDMLFGILSLISLVPYLGDAIAKPFIGIIKMGKINKNIINAGLKSGNAAKVAAEMGKSAKGKAVLDAMKNPKTQSFIGGLLAKLGKLPGMGRFVKDAKTYTKVFTEAATLASKGKGVRIFRSGGLLTKMQRRGLLNRTKLYGKFIQWLTGTGVGAAAIQGMGDDELNKKFTNFLNTEDGQSFFSQMDLGDQEEMVNAMSS
jgi:hypothetical protein